MSYEELASCCFMTPMLSGILIDDIPTDTDLCGLNPEVTDLCEKVADWSVASNFRSAFVIGINGEWGSGKTSILWQMKKRLQRVSAKQKQGKVVIIYWLELSVWKYSTANAFLRALLLKLLESLSDRISGAHLFDQPVPVGKGKQKKVKLGELVESLRTSLYSTTEQTLPPDGRVNWANWSSLFGIKPSGALDDLRTFLDQRIASAKYQAPSRSERFYEIVESKLIRSKVDSSEQFEEIFNTLVDLLCTISPLERLSTGFEGRIILSIDDLDRCLPETAIQILEALKTMMDNRRCCYLVPVDPVIIDAGLASRYTAHKNSSPWFPDYRDYLDKIFHWRLQLMPLSENQVGSMLAELLSTSNSDLRLPEETIQQIARALAIICPNPRRIKAVLRHCGTFLSSETSVHRIVSEIYRIGFQLECGRRYPVFLRNQKALKYVYDLILRQRSLEPTLTAELNQLGIDQEALTFMHSDTRLRDLFFRVRENSAFPMLSEALQNNIPV